MTQINPPDRSLEVPTGLSLVDSGLGGLLFNQAVSANTYGRNNLTAKVQGIWMGRHRSPLTVAKSLPHRLYLKGNNA